MPSVVYVMPPDLDICLVQRRAPGECSGPTRPAEVGADQSGAQAIQYGAQAVQYGAEGWERVAGLSGPGVPGAQRTGGVPCGCRAVGRQIGRYPGGPAHIPAGRNNHL